VRVEAEEESEDEDVTETHDGGEPRNE
jgi:hypothetical protein